MSVSQRLKSFRALNKSQTEEVSKEVIQTMTLQELEQEVIEFGKAHKDKPFRLVFENFQPWVDWFVSHYEASPKPSHQKFIRYVELRLESEMDPNLRAQQQVKAKSVPKKVTTTAAKSTAKGSVDNKVGPESDWEDEFEMMSSHAGMIDMQEELEHVRFENRQMSSRMAQLEMHMHEMVQHLQKLTVKAEV